MPSQIRCFLGSHCVNGKVDLVRDRGAMPTSPTWEARLCQESSRVQRKNSCGGLKKNVFHLREKGEKGPGLGLTSLVESVASTLGLTSSERWLCSGLRQADFKKL